MLRPCLLIELRWRGAVFFGLLGGLLVAVKVIRAETAASPEFLARFRREIAAVQKVSGLFEATLMKAEPVALTHVGFVMGSPGFMSPEWAGGRDFGPSSDVFSRGARALCRGTRKNLFDTAARCRRSTTPTSSRAIPGAYTHQLAARRLPDRCSSITRIP